MSPDGKYVAYAEGSLFWVVEVSSGSMVASWQAPLPQMEMLVTWSPDGKELSIGASEISGVWDLGLWIYDLERKEGRQVLDAPATMGVWSPDKKWLVFDVRGPYFELWLAPLTAGLSTTQSLGPERTPEEYLSFRIKHFTHAIENNRSNIYNYLERAKIYALLGQHQEAAADYGKAIEIDPNNPYLYQARYTEYLRIQQYDKACADLEKWANILLESKASSADACNSLAWLLIAGPQANRNPQIALRLAKKAVQIESRNWSYQNTLGVVQYRAGLYEQALATLTKVDNIRKASNNESHPVDIAFIAMALHQLGRNQEAQTSLNRLREMFENDRYAPEEHYLYEAEQLFAGENTKVYSVWECIKVGKLDEAAQLVEELRSPKDSNTAGGIDCVIKALRRAYYNRGKSRRYEEGTRYAEAIADYEAAVRFDPNYARAFTDLAYLQAACPAPEFRNANKAVENATKACELTNWKDYRYVSTLAAVYAEVGDFASAVKWQKESIDLLPKDKRANQQTNYEARLKLYESRKPFRMGNLWSFSMGEMVGWWKLDETSGTTASDSSGYGRYGTLIGGPEWVNGRIDGGLKLDGVDDYVETGYTANLPVWTISVWVISPTAPSARTWTGPVHREKNYQINWDHIYSNFRGAAALFVGDTWYFANFGLLEANKWYHLAATYDGETLNTYKDSVLITSNTAPSGNPSAETATLNLGKHAIERSYFAGTIDDIRIYNYALSKAEIKALYEANEPPRKKE
jgi:tetratricopeptide (TPR) repeat protein